MTDEMFIEFIDIIEEEIKNLIETNPTQRVSSQLVVSTSFPDIDIFDDGKTYIYPVPDTSPAIISAIGTLIALEHYPEKIEAAYIVREGYLFDTEETDLEEVQKKLKLNYDPEDIPGSKYSVSIFGETLDSRNCLSSIIIDREYDENDNIVNTEIIDIKRVEPKATGDSPLLHALLTAYATTYFEIMKKNDKK